MTRSIPIYRFILLLVCALGCLCSSLAGAADITASQSRIEAVTVMADRAEITRIVTAEVEAGESLVAVEGLPERIDERSVRVLPRGEGDLQGVSLDTVKRPMPPKGDPEALRTRMEELDSRMAAIDATVLGLRKQVELIRLYRSRTLLAIKRQTAVPSDELPSGTLELDRWGKTLDRLSEREIDALDKTRALEVERFRLKTEREELENKNKAFLNPPLVTMRRALVGVTRADRGPVTFALVYRVSGPSWRARHDFRYDPQAGRLRLQAYGLIEQDTGEDWTDVSLTLSTRLPAAGLRPPAITPLQLEGRSAPTRMPTLGVSHDTVSTTDVALGDPEVVNDEEQPPAAQPPAQEAINAAPEPLGRPARSVTVQEKTLDAYVAFTPSMTGEVYRIQKPMTVPGDGQLKQVPIMDAELNADMRLESAPRYSSAVYRRVTLANTTGRTLQPSKAALYWNGDFVGTTTTRAVAPGSEWSLSFGPVPDIDALAVDDLDAENATGVALHASDAGKGKGRVYRFDYRWRIRNRSDDAMRVRMLESIPQSEIEGLTVTVDKDKSSPHRLTDNGIVIFDTDVQAGGESPVTLAYEIFVPANFRMP